MVFSDESGSYQQVIEVRGEEVNADLTFRISAAPTTTEPGPVIVFWQFRIDVSDVDFGDTLSRLVGPPVVESRVPSCDPAGTCEVRVRVSGPIGPALSAADLDWVTTTHLKVAVTLVRTFGEGMEVQAVKPDFSANPAAGTLAGPVPTEGTLLSSAVIAAQGAAPAEIPGDDFGIGGPPYDWATAVAQAMADVPSLSALPTAAGAPHSDSNKGLNASAIALGLLLVFVVSAVVLLGLRRRRQGSRKPV
jgi:hypothetical protein